MTGLGLFIYQSLDAIDGKQARRTNTSTPLGELFDHGCDSVSAGKWRISNRSIFYSNEDFSVRHGCLLLCSSTWSPSMVDVLVLHVFLYCFLLCSLADICLRETSIWNVRPRHCLPNDWIDRNLDWIVRKLNFHFYLFISLVFFRQDFGLKQFVKSKTYGTKI